MDDFEEKLNSLLSSPKDMERIMELAKSISGERREEESTAGGVPDLKMLGLLTRIMRNYSADSDGGKLEILRVLKPYLRKERQDTLTRAVEVAKMAKIAKAAMSEFSGGGHDA